MLAALLAVTEFFPADAIPQQIPDVVAVPVQGNGLCFWSCLYLACRATVALVSPPEDTSGLSAMPKGH